MKKVIIVLIAFIAVYSRAESSDRPANYLTVHQLWQPVLCLSFILEPGEKQTNIFINPLVGVKIVTVTADGKPILPEDIHIDYDGFDTSVTNINEHFIYNLCSDDSHNSKNWIITSVVSMDKKKMVLRDFNIPVGTRELLIKYQIRYSDLRLSEEKTILSKSF